MNIIDLSEKMKDRIWKNYVELTYKSRPTLVNWLLPISFILSIILFSIFHLIHPHSSLSVGVFIAAGILGSFSLFGGFSIFSVFNFNKYSSKYFKKIKEKFSYLEDFGQRYRFYYKMHEEEFLNLFTKFLKHDDFEQLFMLTSSEFEDMKSIEFNEEQKNYILETLKKNGQLKYEDLIKLVSLDNETLRQQENVYKKNLLPHQDFLNEIGVKITLKDIDKQPKYKLKEML